MKPVRIQSPHRHTAPGQHEHEFEPQYGLPELLPASEHILWQGSPDWKTLAVQRFHVRKLVIYFAILLTARVAAQLSDGAALGEALYGSLVLLGLSALAIGLVSLMAWLTARTTVYTLTDKRVVMRIGVVLTVALNLPLKRLQAADLQLHSGRTGDIALQTLGTDRIAYAHLWPHARRWRFAKPEPTLLCVPEAEKLAGALTAAWRSATGERGQSAEASSAPNAAELSTGLAAH
jgi:hypothetical protein